MKLRLASASILGGGCAVWSVAPNSIAFEGGVKSGDVITHVNNKPIKSLPEFKAMIASVYILLLLVHHSAVMTYNVFSIE
jgi:S1-C subfamily serine protease